MQALDVLRLGLTGQDRPGEAARQHVGDRPAADARRVGGGADHGHRARRQHRRQGRKPTQPASPVACNRLASALERLPAARKTWRGEIAHDAAPSHPARQRRRRCLRPGRPGTCPSPARDPHRRADRPVGPVPRQLGADQRAGGAAGGGGFPARAARLHRARRRRRPPAEAGRGQRHRPAVVRPGRGGRGRRPEQHRHRAGGRHAGQGEGPRAADLRRRVRRPDRPGVQRAGGAFRAGHLVRQPLDRQRRAEGRGRQLVPDRRRLRVRP